MRPRLEDYERKDDGIAGFDLHGPGERQAHLDAQVLAGRLHVFEGAVLAPDPTRLSCNAPVIFQLSLRNGQDVAVDIPHVRLHFGDGAVDAKRRPGGYPPAMAPMTQNGSRPVATAGGTGVS